MLRPVGALQLGELRELALDLACNVCGGLLAAVLIGGTRSPDALASRVRRRFCVSSRR